VVALRPGRPLGKLTALPRPSQIRWPLPGEEAEGRIRKRGRERRKIDVREGEERGIDRQKGGLGLSSLKAVAP